MFNTFRTLLLMLMILAPAAFVRADIVIGDVVEVSGDVATIMPLGQQTPSVGDTAQVFGTVPGVQTEVLVGRGRVIELRDGLILAKIDALGTLAIGQAVRITRLPPQGNAAPPVPVKPHADFADLFNGHDLAGWQTPPGSDVAWRVEDGVLRTDGQPRGWLFTQQEFSNFELQLEYRLAPGANGGVAFRAPNLTAPFGPADPSHQGLEVQLIDDASLPSGSPQYQCSGAIWGVVGPANTTDQATRRWNALRITAQGRRVTVAMNGTTVVDANLDDYLDKLAQFPGLRRTTGYFGLQAYSGQLEFRSILIKSLTDAAVATKSTAEFVEVVGRVSEVLQGTATIAIDGKVLPQPGDHANFARLTDMPDLNPRLVGQGTVAEVLGGEILVRLKPGFADVFPGDQMRITVVRETGR